MATAPSNNYFGFNPGSKTYASDTYAAMTRDQWAQYVETFVPIENQLIKYATDPAVVSDAMSRASANVNASTARRKARSSAGSRASACSLTQTNRRRSSASSG